jgi:hypothetical protein
MFSDIDPLVITLAVVAIAVVGSIIGVARRGRTDAARDRATLPAGADAALWSITEVLPDPRNHLAIKDPTSELRLTARERAEAAAAAPTPAVRPAEAARSAQSLAARRAALAKRDAGAPAPTAAEAPAATVETGAAPRIIEAAPSSIELVAATSLDEPLTIFLDDVADDAGRHLTLLPEDLPSAASAPAADATEPRWGESPARAS